MALMDDDSGLSFTESLRKRVVESELGLEDKGLESLDKNQLVKILLSYKLQLETAKSGYQDALLERPLTKFEVKSPTFENTDLGLFTNLILQHLESIPPETKLFKVDGSYDVAANVYMWISFPDRFPQAYEWLNISVQYAIEKLQESQMREWSVEDAALTSLIVGQPNDKVSLYTAIKILKQNLDRISSSIYKLGGVPDNDVLKREFGIVNLIKKLYDVISPE
jgi:hypothetical protein